MPLKMTGRTERNLALKHKETGLRHRIILPDFDYYDLLSDYNNIICGTFSTEPSEIESKKDSFGRRYFVVYCNNPNMKEMLNDIVPDVFSINGYSCVEYEYSLDNMNMNSYDCYTKIDLALTVAEESDIEISNCFVFVKLFDPTNSVDMIQFWFPQESDAVAFKILNGEI